MINSTDPRKLNPKQQWRKTEESWEAIKFTLPCPPRTPHWLALGISRNGRKGRA